MNNVMRTNVRLVTVRYTLVNKSQIFMQVKQNHNTCGVKSVNPFIAQLLVTVDTERAEKALCHRAFSSIRQRVINHFRFQKYHCH